MRAVDAEAIAGVLAAVEAWEAHPVPALHSAVLHACERGLAVEDPAPELDIALGHALANVLLRPDLGVERLAPHRDRLTGPEQEAWLDALMRHGDLPRLSAELRASGRCELAPDHPTARSVASQAALDPHLHWTDLCDAVDASRLLEAGLSDARWLFDRPVESTGAALETAAILLEGWQLEAVTARTTLPSDGDPLTTSGAIPALDDSRRIVAYSRHSHPAGLRPAGAALDLARPPRTASLVVAARAPGGGQLVLAGEGRYQHGVLWLFSCSGPERFTAWLDATDQLLAWRAQGLSESEIAPRLRSTYCAGLLGGG